MVTKKLDVNQSVKELIELHKKLFKSPTGQQFSAPDTESLEQPYAGEIVETFTTYSVYEDPLISQ